MVAAARRRVDAAQGALTTARATLDNPNIRAAQEGIVRKQITQQQAEIAAAAASSAQARFALNEAQANRKDLVVIAPFDGTVITRSAEPGEVVTAGTAIVTLLDLSKVYLRGFVPDGQIGRVAVGQPAHVYLDSNPKEPIDAFVSRADPEATFTPENTYFRDDRVKQVDTGDPDTNTAKVRRGNIRQRGCGPISRCAGQCSTGPHQQCLCT